MANPTHCVSCGKKITTDATKCPKCQTPVPSNVLIADKKSERKGTLWAYLTGTLFIITGLGAFQIGIIPAIMLILGGALALPFVRAGLVKLSGFKTDQFLVILSAILIIGGVIGYTSSVKNDRLDRIENTAAVSE